MTLVSWNLHQAFQGSFLPHSLEICSEAEHSSHFLCCVQGDRVKGLNGSFFRLWKNYQSPILHTHNYPASLFKNTHFTVIYLTPVAERMFLWSQLNHAIISTVRFTDRGFSNVTKLDTSRKNWTGWVCLLPLVVSNCDLEFSKSWQAWKTWMNGTCQFIRASCSRKFSSSWRNERKNSHLLSTDASWMIHEQMTL